MPKEVGAVRALVASDEARSGLPPTGFDHGEGRISLERYSSDCTRVLNAAGNVEALIERLANGKWSIFVGGYRQTRRQFTQVRQAAFWWLSHRSSAIAQGGYYDRLTR